MRHLLLLMLLAARVIADPYVGSTACSGCHRAIYDSYVRTAMGRSITKPNVNLVSDAIRVKTESLHRTYSVERHAGRLLQRETSEENGNSVFDVEHELAYAIGSGENGISFAIKRGDHLFQAPLSYYVAAQRWDLSPGFAATGEGFNRPVTEACIVCHAGRAQAVEHGEGRYQDPPLLEPAIGCENCHGPGQAHVATPSKSSIVNPRRLSPRVAEDICMRCHQAGETRVLLPQKTNADFRPGVPLIQTLAIFSRPAQQADADLLEHHSSMKVSKCYQATNGRLSCLTCHNPHEQPEREKKAAYFNAKCMTCHTNESCRLSLAERVKTEPADNCVGCHMPKRAVSGISHSALTNHRIPRSPFQPPPQSLMLPQATPGLPGLVVVNQTSDARTALPLLTRLAAYGELMNVDKTLEPEYFKLLDEAQRTMPEDPLVLAALGRKALLTNNIPDAVAQLSKAESKGEASSITYADLSDALRQSLRSEQTVKILEKAVTLFPFSQPLRKRLIQAYIAQKDYPKARTALDAYVNDFPEDGFMRGLLKQVSGG